MSENFNTENEENLNEEERKTIRVSINADFANEMLSKLNLPFPDASELHEIVLVVKSLDSI